MATLEGRCSVSTTIGELLGSTSFLVSSCKTRPLMACCSTKKVAATLSSIQLMVTAASARLMSILGTNGRSHGKLFLLGNLPQALDSSALRVFVLMIPETV